MPDFDAIRRHCDGMMKAEVYQRIYETALAAPGDLFVEVGTAHGAATVCLALALRDSGRLGGKVYTFDTFDRGGRAPYKTSRSNLDIAQDNLAHFGVSDFVEVIPGDIRVTSGKAPQDCHVGLLMLDADGAIDRDLRVFFDAVVVGAPVIIDDMADRVRVKSLPDKRVRVDQKHRLTHMLARSAEKHGLIEHVGAVNQTYFGRKRNAVFSDWPDEQILLAYRSLVFATSEAPLC